MDHRSHQTIRCHKRLRGSPTPLGRRTHTGLAQSQPPPCQGLRANHRIGHRLALHRLNPDLHPPYRKSMKSKTIILNQTLRAVTKTYLDDLGVDERILPVIMSQSREEAIWVDDLREVADVPVFSLAFEEQAIEACALSASDRQKQKDAFMRLLMNRHHSAIRQHTDAIQCVEWE